MYAQGVLCKFGHALNFETFIDGLNSVRIYKDQIELVK